MTNSLDYIKWRGDISIEQSPVNEVDMSLFCYLPTMDLNGILSQTQNSLRIKEVAELYKERNKEDSIGVLQPSRLPTMIELLSKSDRFADLIVCDYEAKVSNEFNEQFGALTILLPDGSFCVSFQGTDDTLIGWKEDCYLAISNKVASQEDAKTYLEHACSIHEGKIRVCGHSKGGNLAVSASTSVSEECKNRIIQVFNSDGPGFREEYLTTPEYLEMKDRITTVLSNHSLIGILMNRPGNTMYVSSTVSGPTAHDSFNWEVLGKSFVKKQGLEKFEKKFDTAINSTINTMTEAEKILFVDELFKNLECKGASTVTDLKKMKPTDFVQVLMSLNSNKSLRRFVLSIVKKITVN